MSKISFRTRVLLIVGFASFLCAVISVGGFLHFNRKETERGIINKQRTIHSQLAASTEFVARQGGLPGVVAKLRAKYSSADQLTSEEKKEVLNQVPIYSALVIGERNSKTDHYEFRVSSDEPRRKEHTATPEELAIQQKFEADTELKELVINDGQRITTYRPVRLLKAQGCLTCHGDPATSPWGNGRDILGFKMENWGDGKLHGLFAISQNIDAVAMASTEGHFISPSQWLIMAIIAGAIFAVLMSAYLIRGPLNSLNHVATMLAGASNEVTAAANQIASSAQALSQASSQQAASLQQTAASIEEMSSMVTKNSDNAQQTSTSSGESRTKAEQGQHVVEQMIHSMNEINQSNSQITQQIEQSNSEISEIVHVIQEIGNKTKVINDIVFQTKLLSFNASVEAARAGEHGKGFAVVAEEIGNLAQMSGTAANEISQMLEGSITKVTAIVKDMESKVEKLIASGNAKVENGAQIAQECGRVLNDIVANVANVSRMANEISTASQEQSQGIHELTKAMSQLDQVTQQNATSSEQSAHSAEQLSTQAESLKHAVAQLLTTIQGGNESPSAGANHSDGDSDSHVYIRSESAGHRHAS